MIEAPATPPSAERGPVRDPERERRGRLLRRPTFPAVLGMLVALIVIVPLLEELAGLRVGQMLGLAGLAIPILAVAAASDRPRHRRVAFALAAISALANGATLPERGVPLWAGSGASLIFLAYTTYLETKSQACARRARGALPGYSDQGDSYSLIHTRLSPTYPVSRPIRLGALQHPIRCQLPKAPIVVDVCIAVHWVGDEKYC